MYNKNYIYLKSITAIDNSKDIIKKTKITTLLIEKLTSTFCLKNSLI